MSCFTSHFLAFLALHLSTHLGVVISLDLWFLMLWGRTAAVSWDLGSLHWVDERPCASGRPALCLTGAHPRIVHQGHDEE